MARTGQRASYGKNTLKQTFKTKVFPVASARIFMLSLYVRDEDMRVPGAIFHTNINTRGCEPLQVD
jgi:hypothetical protein